MDPVLTFFDTFLGVGDFAGVGALILVVGFAFMIKGLKPVLTVLGLLVVMMPIANMAT